MQITVMMSTLDYGCASAKCPVGVSALGKMGRVIPEAQWASKMKAR
jgi:hypothetical protein